MNKRAVGSEKESLACTYLEAQGMTILHKNFRSRQGEVDLIGLHQDCLVFIEVKYRSNTTSGTPEGAVGYTKQSKICRTCDFFRIRYPQYQEMQVRFDVVAICEKEIRWYQNAFPYIDFSDRNDHMSRKRSYSW